MLRRRIEFAGARVRKSADMAGKLDDRDLHAEADAEIGDALFAAILCGEDHALDASSAEAARHDDAVDAA